MKLRRFAAAWLACSLGVLTGCPLGTDFGAGPGDEVIPGSGEKVNPGPGDGVTPGTPVPDEPTGTPVPAELQGQWTTILTYVPGYYEGPIDLTPTEFTGSIGVYYYFGADGQYRYDLNSAMTYFDGFCFRTTSWTEWGTLGVAGSEVFLTPARATNVITDRCGESVLDDNAPTAASTLTVTPEQDPTGWPMLRLRLPSGEELLLEKCRDCE